MAFAFDQQTQGGKQNNLDLMYGLNNAYILENEGSLGGILYIYDRRHRTGSRKLDFDFFS